MKLITLATIALFLVGCATSTPRNRENACLLLVEKSDWSIALDQASKRWKIPSHTILSIIYHESKFIADAKPPRRKTLGIGFIGRRISSAYGYSQALDGTWEDYLLNTGNWGAKRTRFEDSVDFIGWYLNRSVKKLGISRRNAYQLYLAYHEGDAGYKKGRHHKKPSIKRYARKVQSTAVSYKRQMNSCSRYASF